MGHGWHTEEGGRLIGLIDQSWPSLFILPEPVDSWFILASSPYFSFQSQTLASSILEQAGPP